MRRPVPVVKSGFNWRRWPNPKALLRATVCAGVGLLLFILPSLLPPFYRSAQRAAAASSLANFQLHDEVNPGLFHRFPRATDTFPDAEAAFWALSAAQRLGAPKGVFTGLENMATSARNQLKEYASADVDDLHYAAAVASILKEPIPEEIEKHVMSLFVTGSGFKPTTTGVPTLSATYHALELLEVIGAAGKLQSNESTVLRDVEQYVLSLQDGLSGGFHSHEGAEGIPTLSDTFRAVSVLLRCNPAGQNASMALTNAGRFTFYCRGADSGFRNSPAISAHDRSFARPSPSSSTAQAIYIAASLRKLKLSFPSGVYRGALGYLASCLSGRRGVVEHATSGVTSLQATYLVGQLLNAGIDIPNGYLVDVAQLCRAIGLTLIVAAGVAWYSTQMDLGMLRASAKRLARITAALAGAAAVLLVVPQLALPAYLACIAYLGVIYYQAQQQDDEDGTLSSVSSVSALVFLGLVVGVQMGAPLVLGQASALPVFALWSGGASFLTTYLACYLVSRRTATVFSTAALMAWILYLLGTALLLFSRDHSLIYRLMTIAGSRILALVVYPAIALATAELGAALAFAIYAGPAPVKLPVKKVLNYIVGLWKTKRN
jgi:prenyltransferase beta subunit